MAELSEKKYFDSRLLGLLNLRYSAAFWKFGVLLKDWLATRQRDLQAILRQIGYSSAKNLEGAQYQSHCAYASLNSMQKSHDRARLADVASSQ